MPLIAVLCVVAAAFTHAGWNLLAKRAAHCRHFNWYYSLGAVLLYLPLAVGALQDFLPNVTGAALVALGASAVLHALYSASLLRGYRASDLSIVYPVARGTGPLLSFLGAIVVLSERPGWIAAVGAVAVVIGVLGLAGARRIWRAFRDGNRDRVVTGVLWGLLTGTLIAAYTLNDGYAVKVLLISPILVDYVGNLFRSAAFAPFALADLATVRAELPRYWKEALGVALAGPLGYILVLYAMTLAPVSHVAPARELSMMIGAYFGARFLGEGQTKQRVAFAALIVVGVVLLAIG